MNNSNSKGFVTANYEKREFTRANDEEKNKKFVFVGDSKPENLNTDENNIPNKSDIHSRSYINESDIKIIENPAIIENNVQSSKNENKFFDQKKIVELIQNVIRYNEKNNVRGEKSKIIEELNVLNHPRNLNNILNQNLEKNLNKEVYTDLVSHANMSNYSENKEEMIPNINVLSSDEGSIYTKMNNLSYSPHTFIQSKTFDNLDKQNHVNSETNLSYSDKGENVNNEHYNGLTGNFILNHNQSIKNRYNTNLYNQYQLNNPILSEQINEVYAFPKNNIYVDQNTLNSQGMDDLNINSKLDSRHLINKMLLHHDCPCEKLITCKPCEFNLENIPNYFPAESPINMLSAQNCPCARKKICPPCAPASLIHDVALHKIKLINDNLSLRADEMRRFAKITEEIEKNALNIANKLNESNTKSFLAKNKMIELNEKARKIALSIDFQKTSVFPCDPLRYPCEEINVPLSNSSPFQINSDYIYNPLINYNLPTNDYSKDSGYLYIKNQSPYYQQNQFLDNNYSTTIVSEDNFKPQISEPNKPSRHYIFEKENSVKTEVIDKEEIQDEDPMRNRKRIYSNIRKTNKNQEDRPNYDKRTLRHNQKVTYPKANINLVENHNPIECDEEKTNENVNDREDNQKKDSPLKPNIQKKTISKKHDENLKLKELQMIKEFGKNEDNKNEEKLVNASKGKNKSLKGKEPESNEEVEIIREELRNFNKKLSKKESNVNLANKEVNSEKKLEIKDNTK